jgi:hypothetical protein
MKPAGPARLPIGDWNLLFEAVTYRLRHEVCEHGATTPAAQQALHDCVDALGLLHAALALERRERPTPAAPPCCSPPPCAATRRAMSPAARPSVGSSVR